MTTTTTTRRARARRRIIGATAVMLAAMLALSAYAIRDEYALAWSTIAGVMLLIVIVTASPLMVAAYELSERRVGAQRREDASRWHAAYADVVAERDALIAERDALIASRDRVRERLAEETVARARAARIVGEMANR